MPSGNIFVSWCNVIGLPAVVRTAVKWANLIINSDPSALSSLLMLKKKEMMNLGSQFIILWWTPFCGSEASDALGVT